MQATTFLFTNRQKGAIGKNDLYMKNLVTLRFMLVSLFAIMSMAVSADTIEYSTGDGFNYRLDTEAKTAELAGYNGSAREISISESVTYEGVVYSVTSLGELCFLNRSSLTSINIPSSVTSLGEGCFAYCSSLTSINIPSSVTSLGGSCFSGCYSLTSINIPSSVTSMGEFCFVGCSSLTSINIPSSVTSLGEYCFTHCSSLTSIVVDAGNSVYDSRENCNAVIETESNTMICGCAGTVIPSSVTSLGEDCFYGCSSLTSINIPSSVTSLGEGCFSGCSSLTAIVVDAGNSVYDSRENCNAVIETKSNTMICGCAGTVIPSSVTSLGYRCFADCYSLTSINIPSSVTSLGEECFSGCSSLTSINIPSSVTSLGKYCFMGCSSLKTVTCEIPAPIGDYSIFYNTPINEATLYVPKASLNSYKTTSPWSGFGTILAIKSSGIETNTVAYQPQWMPSITLREREMAA